jgi:hypothetical protein
VLTLPRHYNRPHAEKDILDGLHAARAGGGFPASFLVGLRRYHPYSFRCMVGRLPQRLVLGDKGVNERYGLFSSICTLVDYRSVEVGS